MLHEIIFGVFNGVDVDQPICKDIEIDALVEFNFCYGELFLIIEKKKSQYEKIQEIFGLYFDWNARQSKIYDKCENLWHKAIQSARQHADSGIFYNEQSEFFYKLICSYALILANKEV